MRINESIDWSYLLLFPYLALVFTPLLQLYMRLRFAAPLVFLWLALAIARSPGVQLQARAGRQFAYAFLFLALDLALGNIYQLFGHGGEWTVVDLLNNLQFLLPLVILHLSIRNNRRRELGWTIVWCLVCLTVTAVQTIRGESLIENASRALTGSLAGDYATAEDAFLAGVGGYGHVYGMGLLIWPMLYVARIIPRALGVLWVLFVGVFLVATYSANYTICMASIAFGGVMWGVASVWRQRLTRLASLLLICFVVAMASPQVVGFLASSLLRVQSITMSKWYESRIGDMADTIGGAGGNTYTTMRIDLAWLSWRGFLAHPWVGIGKWNARTRISEGMPTDSRVGGHSFLFDRLGSGGVLGFSVVALGIVFLFRYLKTVSLQSVGLQGWPAMVIFGFQASMIGIINPLDGWVIYSVPCLLLPGMTCLFRRPSANATPRFGFIPAHRA